MPASSNTSSFAQYLESLLRFGTLWEDIARTAPGDAGPEQLYAHFTAYTERMQKLASASLESMLPTGPLEEFSELLHRYWPAAADAPALGVMREWQLKLQAIERARMGWQQASGRLRVVHSELIGQAWREFAEDLAQAPHSDSFGLKELHKRWTDKLESIYQARVLTEEYSVLYGDTINRLMDLRRAWAGLTDDVLAALNLPGRKEIDGIHQRLTTLASGRRAPAEIDPVAEAATDGISPRLTTLEQRLTDLSEVVAQAREVQAQVPDQVAAAILQLNDDVSGLRRELVALQRASASATAAGESNDSELVSAAETLSVPASRSKASTTRPKAKSSATQQRKVGKVAAGSRPKPQRSAQSRSDVETAFEWDISNL
ncbi:MAG: hypothetical protein H6978_10275 [Gammaproteobacteria bacterium]|nr:hypothetical protein [Gammaproteobacteria bacterium]